jgi:RHS repeat-associated protein
MRCAKWIFAVWSLWFATAAFAFNPDAPEYVVFETATRPDGCRWVYIVPRPQLFMLASQVATPLLLAPSGSGMRGTLCADGSWSQWRREDLTADDLLAPRYGATLSSMKPSRGDFDGDGTADLLLQAGDRIRHSLLLALDARGVPRVLRNFHRRLSVLDFPLVDGAGLDQNGVAGIAAASTTLDHPDGQDASLDTDARMNVGTTTSLALAPTFNVTLAGSMDGRFNVDERGAATYELAIAAAPGTAGVTPRISLNYSSSDDDGIAGRGWSIGGLSSITRCRQTLAQDNAMAAIGLDAGDRFCLDGQRLILVGGVYGGNGSTYRTELDSHAVITAYGSLVGHPAYFKVERKDGSLSYYGDGVAQGANRSAPVVNTGGAVLTWAISRFEDSVGNAIRFQYISSGTTNEHLISRIDYAYGMGAGNVGNSTSYLQFNYQNRPDGSSGYVAGARVARTQRLVSIRSMSDGMELRTYNLVYRTPDNPRAQSFLEKIHECVGIECLAPTTFEWQLNRGGFAPAVVVASEAGAKLSTLRGLDINGDGRSDLVYRRLTAPYPLLYRLSTGEGLGPTLPLLASTLKVVNVDDSDVAIFDINGDSRQDLLYVAAGTGVYRGTLFLGEKIGFDGGTAYDTGMAQTSAADIDGDGLPDLTGANLLPMYRPAQRQVVNGLWTTVFGTQRLIVEDNSSAPTPPPGCNEPSGYWYMPLGLLGDGADFNGDGRVDFTAQASYQRGSCDANYAGVAISKGGGEFSTQAWTTGIATASADMNGDGLADQWYDDTTGNRQLRFSTGAGFTAPSRVGGTVVMERAVYLDYDGDGFTDILWPSIYGSLVVQPFDPATGGYGAPQATAVPFQPASDTLAADRYIPFDIDGDGHADLLRINHHAGGSTVTLYRSGDTRGAGNRIVRIDNGTGRHTAITYKPLTDNTVYTAGSDARNAAAWPGAPVFDVKAPHYVVASVSTTAPTAHPTIAGAVNHSAVRGTRYQYGGLKLQVGGRGSLGFSWMRTIDEQTGIASTTWYRQVFPFIGRPVLTHVMSGSGGRIQTIVATDNQIVRTGVGGARYYQIYQSRREEFNFDPVSGIENAYMTTENGVPDEWGNIPLTIVSRYPVESHTAFLTRTVTRNAYGDTAYSRRFGRTSSTRITFQRAGQPDIARTSIYTYMPAGSRLKGLLATESVSAADGAPSRSLSYQYDHFGNRTRVTASAIGNSSRYEDTTFDVAGRFVASRSGDFYDGASWRRHVVESVLARNVYGRPTRVQHLNGLIVSYGYDALGRETSRSENTGATRETRYVRGGMSGARYHIATTAKGGAAGIEYFDALGRSMTKGELGFDGRWIHRDTEYDGQGRIKRQSAPHYAGDPVHWTTNDYDAFRLQGRSEPASGGVYANTSVSYYGLATITTNALGQRRIEVRNAVGELVEAIDHLGGSIKYGYDAAGLLQLATATALRDGRSIATSTRSVNDALGRKIKMVDPDRGTSFYSYNGFDELTDQCRLMSVGNFDGTLAQAVGEGLPMQCVRMQYDRRGRLTQRADYPPGDVPASIARWQYDTQYNGVGQLAESFIEGEDAGHQYGYDSHGRLSARLTVNDDYYLEEATWDSSGRVATLTDAMGPASGIRNVYNAAGHLESIADLATGSTLYRVRARDAWGHVTSAVFGNGTTADWQYDGGSGRMVEQVALANKTQLQKIAYGWDAVGNLIARRDRGALLPGGTKNLQQSFCYDGLNRLLKTYNDTLNGSCTIDTARQDQQYDGFGNILHKAGIGAFNYDPVRPFRLQGTSDGVRYVYDNGGNVVSDSSGRAFDYSVFDKPMSVRRAGQWIDFRYGADRELRKRTDGDTGTGETTTTHRIGNVERIGRANGSYEFRRHIAGIAAWSHRFDRDGAPVGVKKYYVHTDAQGSPLLLTGDSGTQKQQWAYDSWGRRAWPNNPALSLPAAAFLPASAQPMTIGFTGHDMLDAVGLVNMGGRVYDPRLGRFLQADPFVQAPAYLQSFNRYAYVFNAPLRFTDPSGFNGAGDDAVTLGSSLGTGWSGTDTLLSTISVSGAGYGNNYTSFDAGNGYGLYNGLIDFNFGATAAATPLALSVFLVGSGNKGSVESMRPELGLRPEVARRKSTALGDAFIPGAENDDTRMDCSSGVCYVTARRDIYLTGHRVRGIGPFHTALQYENGAGVEWISAGFDGYTLEGMNRLASGAGNLASGARPNDAPSRNIALGRIIPPPGLTVDEYFQRLKETSENYRNTADYDLFPGIADGYNSNSYIRGLLDVTGGVSTVDLGNFVGGDKPLPAYYFLRQ